jgi:hypothetical protein
MTDQAPTGADGLVRPPADARCAVHADVEAVAVCRRCGNYMCRGCSRDGASPQCDTCRARAAAEFPFSRERWRLFDLVSYGWKRFKSEWLMLSVTSLIFFVAIYGISFAVTFGGVALTAAVPDTGDRLATTVLRMSIQVAQFLLQVVLQLGLQLGFLSVALDVVEGRPAAPGGLFARFDRFPSALLQLLVIYLGLSLCAIPIAAAYLYFVVGGDDGPGAYAALAVGAVLALPTLYAALGCAFAMPQLVHDPNATAFGALRDSFEIVRGHRLSLIGCALVIVLISTAGAVACCIGFIPALGLSMLVYCSLFLALKTPTPATAAIAQTR